MNDYFTIGIQKSKKKTKFKQSKEASKSDELNTKFKISHPINAKKDLARLLPPPLDCKKYIRSVASHDGEDVFSIVKSECDNTRSLELSENVDHENYETLGVAGVGTRGMVIKVRCRKTSVIYARKSTPINWSESSTESSPIVSSGDSLAKVWAQCATREIKILRKLCSEYIVKFKGAYVYGKELFTLMEFIWPGNLKLVSTLVGPMNEDQLTKIAVQILKGLDYLSKMRIIHRDIKPSNIMFSIDGLIKLADFGISIDITDNTDPNICLGSHGYLAPELISSEALKLVTRSEKPSSKRDLLSPPNTPDLSLDNSLSKPSLLYNTNTAEDILKSQLEHLAFCSDIWSYGIVLLELGLGKYPYPSFFAKIELFAYICQEEPPMLPRALFSRNLRKLITKCLVKDPVKRPCPSQLLENSEFEDLWPKCDNLSDLAKTVIDKMVETKK